MVEGVITIKARKVLTNPLLYRRQMVCCLKMYFQFIQNFSLLTFFTQIARRCQKSELRERIAKIFKTTSDVVIPYGFRCHFGGGRSTGFANVYDSVDYAKRFEPKFRLLRQGIGKKVEKGGRKQRKERKNRQKKVRGTKKTKVQAGKK
uniref:40S ribosomal protein S24 n=1 Tax=Meloidogyne enterolobii TaxID=390850 RepID=A0A6V7XZI7_MELEN|nr:unnamed protein product [Meloidogyne enterolobii]